MDRTRLTLWGGILVGSGGALRESPREHGVGGAPGRRMSGAAGCMVLAMAALCWLPTAGEAQRAPADRCAELVDAARGGRSLAEMQRLIEAKRPDERLLRDCGEALQRDPQVAEVVRREIEVEQATLAQRARSVWASYQRQPAQLAINRRVLLAREEGRSRVRLFSTREPEPARTPSPAPVISVVTPTTVVPDTDLVIEGTGFGSQGGSVRLKLQGKTYTAAVNQWTSTWISAYLGDEVTGVIETNGAVLEVQPQGASAISKVVPFVPVYESAVINDIVCCLHAWPFPGEQETTLAEMWTLENHWEVTTDPWTSLSGGIECELDGPPVANPGNDNLATRIRVSWGWFQGPSCLVHFDIQGPRGFDHGLGGFW